MSELQSQVMDADRQHVSLRLGTKSFPVLILVFYFLSGVAALAYQVLWAKMLALQFGVSIFGVVVTAAAFMLGLGGGSLYGRMLQTRVRSPLLLFAALEAAVALYALSLPLLSQWLDAGINSLGEISLTAWYAFYAVATITLIALPAFAMGAGFPLVLRAIEHSRISLAKLYGVNTCGGALGALLPLLLLPLLGWRGSSFFAAMCGLVVAVGMYLLSRQSLPNASADSSEQHGISKLPYVNLLAYAGVGAGALMLEIGWTRLFGMLLLRTEYVMAIILCVFLVGIGAGSLLARYLRSRYWLELLPVLTALFALLSLMSVGPVAAWAEGSEFHSLGTAMLAQGLVLALVTLPVTLLLGAWLPLLNQHLNGCKSTGASLYGANSVGAALGALFAGFVLLPGVGTTATVAIAGGLLFVSGMMWARPRTWLALPVVIGLAWYSWAMPTVSVLAPLQQAQSQDLMVHEDGLAITHVVEQADGQRLLLADLQRMDASSDPSAVVSQRNQVRLPLLLHPNPSNILFLGLGTGISASASLALPGLQRTAVELSQGAIIASAEWFDEVNQHVHQSMDVVRDDARRYLRQTGQHYDVIVGDLFHPDFVGRSALLSVEQFERAEAKLNPGGVFVQWLAINQFDVDSLRVVLRSFQQSFSNSYLFIDGFRIAMVGLKDEQLNAQRTLVLINGLAPQNAKALTGGEGEWTWLGRYCGRLNLDEKGPVQSEWAPVIEYRLPKMRYGGELDMAAMLGWLLRQRPPVEQAVAELGVTAGQLESFERAYFATDLALRGWVAQFSDQPQQAQRLLHMAYQANADDHWVSGAIADQMYASLDSMVAQGMDREQALEAILRVYPEHIGALKSRWQQAVLAGDAESAARYRETLTLLSPLDKSLR